MAKPAKTPTQEAVQIGATKLKNLLKAAMSAAQDSHEITSSLGGKIASAVENDHLHKKAFGTLRMMNKMTPERLSDYWDTLQFYVDISGLGERAASAPKLRLETGEAEDDEEGETGGKDGKKVTPFPKPTSVAAE